MKETCRVCSKPATRRLGVYAFCDEHFKKAKGQRAWLWPADLVTIFLTIGFVLAAWAVEGWLHPQFNSVTLIAVGVLMSLIPAALWMGMFYRRDRYEPEPKGLVFQVFVLGALLAAAVGAPLLRLVFNVDDWLHASWWAQLLGGILVVGFSQEFLKYLAVRGSVYNLEEFDERTDGIIYGTAAGLGYATALNIALVIGSGGVDLAAGAFRITITALAQASFAGVVGYFLARDKFEHRPLWWMPLGLTIAAVLNGVFAYLRGIVTVGRITSSGSLSNPWIGLLLAAGLAMLLTWTLSKLMQQDLASAVASRKG
jgi:RsiW-degrading membrane proteinase PrsW (M82 family)